MDEPQDFYGNENWVPLKIEMIFPGRNPHPIMSVLRQFWFDNDQLTSYVHLAILKLSAGDMDRLQRLVDTAKSDYRDVLIIANSRNQLDFEDSRESFPEGTTQEMMVEADRNEWREWLLEGCPRD